MEAARVQSQLTRNALKNSLVDIQTGSALISVCQCGFDGTGSNQSRAATRSDEDGNILLLSIGYVLVIVLMVLLTTTLSSLHLERKQLLALADSAALVASDAVAKEIYQATLQNVAPDPNPAQVAREVTAFLAQASQNLGETNAHLIALHSQPTGEVSVELGLTTSVLAAFDLTGPTPFQIKIRATGYATTLSQ